MAGGALFPGGSNHKNGVTAFKPPGQRLDAFGVNAVVISNKNNQ